MDFELSEDQTAIFDMARSFAEDQLAPHAALST
jgi:alkylation response protein AidB-like acyl-CoA dehydrogenase